MTLYDAFLNRDERREERDERKRFVGRVGELFKDGDEWRFKTDADDLLIKGDLTKGAGFAVVANGSSEVFLFMK
jgi:hypothetical protein